MPTRLHMAPDYPSSMRKEDASETFVLLNTKTF